MSAGPARQYRALAVVADLDLIEDLQRLVSACDMHLDVLDTGRLAGGAALVSGWTRADAVLVGVGAAEAVVAAALPRRAHVLLVVPGAVTDADWRTAVGIGAESLVALPDDEQIVVEALAAACAQPASGRVVSVMGCRGGAGASVLAVAMALAAVRRGQSPFLLDLDPLACGLPTVLGADRLEGLVWPEVSAARGRIRPDSLFDAVPRVRGVRVLAPGSGVQSPDPEVVSAVVDAARRSSPVTVLDVGRAFGAAQRQALADSDELVLLVPADVRSVRSAQRLLTAPDMGGLRVRIVVRGPNPGGLVVEDVAEALDVVPFGVFGADRNLDRLVERGEPPGGHRRSPLARAAEALLAALCP